MTFHEPSMIKAEQAYRSAQIREQIVDAHRARVLRKQRREHRRSLAVLRFLG